MPQTGAQRQAAYRARQVARIAELESEADDLRRRLGTAQAGLAAANAELERMADRVCRHPAEAVSGGTCRACGADIW